VRGVSGPGDFAGLLLLERLDALRTEATYPGCGDQLQSPLTAEEYLGQLVHLTGMSASDWSDFLSLSPQAQAVVAQGYKDASWVQSPDRLAQVLAVLSVAGTVFSVISGAAGAATALAALKSL
jgi:hypothetical protein